MKRWTPVFTENRTAFPPEEVAKAIGLQVDMVTRIYRNITIRRGRTNYLRAQPIYP